MSECSQSLNLSKHSVCHASWRKLYNLLNKCQKKGAHTFLFQLLEMSTHSLQCCLAWPKPILSNPNTKEKFERWINWCAGQIDPRRYKGDQVQTHCCHPQIKTEVKYNHLKLSISNTYLKSCWWLVASNVTNKMTEKKNAEIQNYNTKWNCFQMFENHVQHTHIKKMTWSKQRWHDNIV